MKKTIMTLLALIMFMPVAVNAQNKALQKALKKEYKTKMKEYKKESWKIFGTSRSLEVALLTHYDKLTTLGENGYEVVGICARYKSDNVGHQAAINNACNTYARNAGSHVKGRVVSDIASNGDDTSAEFDHFYAAYETLVEKEIKGELQESYSIYKVLGNGEKTMQTFFIVNEDAATKARIRAYENALKESEAAQKYAEKVSQFVREGFKEE
ncbi:MAG: hypothetical protein IJR02_03145 [Bacteroidaceae bacterium]|nr:hypothetical protein [Bacteroidaceae bacterium]